jgi:ketosteroid isomerase-like protein
MATRECGPSRVVSQTMTPLEHMQEYIAAARRGDWETASARFADDVVLHIPGRSRLAGERRGRDHALAYIEDARARSRDHDVELTVEDMLASEERVALMVRERFTTPGGPVEIRRCNVYRWREGRIAEVWIFEADQYAVDALLA